MQSNFGGTRDHRDNLKLINKDVLWFDSVLNLSQGRVGSSKQTTNKQHLGDPGADSRMQDVSWGEAIFDQI